MASPASTPQPLLPSCFSFSLGPWAYKCDKYDKCNNNKISHNTSSDSCELKLRLTACEHTERMLCSIS
jgi:hypothetical protein